MQAASLIGLQRFSRASLHNFLISLGVENDGTSETSTIHFQVPSSEDRPREGIRSVYEGLTRFFHLPIKIRFRRLAAGLCPSAKQQNYSSCAGALGSGTGKSERYAYYVIIYHSCPLPGQIDNGEMKQDEAG